MSWLIFALGNALSMSVSNVFTKLATGKANPILGAAITLSTAAILVILVSILSAKSKVSGDVLLFPILAGVFAGLGMISWFMLFTKGASLSAGGIVAILGVISFTVLWGVLFLGEKLSLIKVAGLFFAIIASAMLSL